MFLFSRESLRYRVLSTDGSSYGQILRLIVARDDLWENLCPRTIHDTAINSSIFSYSSGYRNVTLSYGCSISIPGSPGPPNQFDCLGNSSTNPSFYSINGLGYNLPADVVYNRSISVPINQDRAGDLGNSTALQEALKNGFRLKLEANNSKCEECSRSGGRCGHNSTSNSNSFLCYCSDRPYDLARELNAISLGATELVLLVAGILFFFLVRNSSRKGVIWQKLDEEKNQNIEAFMRGYGSFAPKSYSFIETDGYDSVYKGTLPDGRLVAIKILKDN